TRTRLPPRSTPSRPRRAAPAEITHTRLHRSGVVDLDLTVMVAHLNMRQRRQRCGKLMLPHLAIQPKRRAVTRAIEPACRLVAAQEAALVRADARDRREAARIIHNKSDRRRSRETHDFAGRDGTRGRDRFPRTLVGNEFL